jgi:hypothetical protein
MEEAGRESGRGAGEVEDVLRDGECTYLSGLLILCELLTGQAAYC